MVICRDGSDPASGVMRHADAGHRIALDREHGLRLPAPQIAAQSRNRPPTGAGAGAGFGLGGGSWSFLRIIVLLQRRLGPRVSIRGLVGDASAESGRDAAPKGVPLR